LFVVFIVVVVLLERQVKRKKRESSLSSCNKFLQLARIEIYNSAKVELRRNQVICPLPDDAVEKRLSLFRVSAMSSTLSFLSTSTQALFLRQCSKNLQVEIANTIKFKSVEFCLPIF